MNIKNKAVIRISLLAFFLNFILFAVKLYVGLSSNIISIYSDGINNFFDSLSGIVTVVCFIWAAKGVGIGKRSIVSKTEQLVTLGLSVIVAFSGLVFLYNSLERLMYPTPMFYAVKFLWALIATALCKLVMCFVFNRQYGKTDSQVLRMMALDCRLDFFINLVTIITLVMSRLELYAVDAFCGIAISVLIVISGVRMLVTCVRQLVGVPKSEQMQTLCELLEQYGLNENSCEVDFHFTDKLAAYVTTELQLGEDEKQGLKNESFEKTGINIYFIK